MAASMALPPSRSTCAPASEASRCGVAMTPFVTEKLSRRQLSRRYELDRPRLNLEECRQKARILAVEVDADLLGRGHRYALPVHELDLRVVLVHVRARSDGANTPDGLELAGVADEDHVEHAIGRRGGRRHPHAPSEVLAVRDHDLLCLEVVSDAVDHHVHRLVFPGEQRHQGRQRESRATEALAAVVDAVDDIAADAG